MEKSDNLEVSISKLDNLLTEGQLRYTTLRLNYSQFKDKDGFNINDYISEVTKSLNEWFQAVVKVLDEEFTEKYHRFHFIQHQGSSMSLVGIPLDLSNWFVKFEEHLYALEDIILRLEERRNLAVRQEIAEKEHEADILYKVTYSGHTREVKLNDILLTKTDFDSENDRFFLYVYGNPNRPIGLKELTEHMGEEPKKRLAHIVRDLGFVHELGKIFFPAVTKNEVMFVNPISKQYAYKHNLPPISFKTIGRQSKTK